MNNSFTIYGGKIKWNENQGLRADVIKETDKALLLKTDKGELWMPKSIFNKYYMDNGMGSMVLILPNYYELKFTKPIRNI